MGRGANRAGADARTRLHGLRLPERPSARLRRRTRLVRRHRVAAHPRARARSRRVARGGDPRRERLAHLARSRDEARRRLRERPRSDEGRARRPEGLVRPRAHAHRRGDAPSGSRRAQGADPRAGAVQRRARRLQPRADEPARRPQDRRRPPLVGHGLRGEGPAADPPRRLRLAGAGARHLGAAARREAGDGLRDRGCRRPLLRAEALPARAPLGRATRSARNRGRRGGPG